MLHERMMATSRDQPSCSYGLPVHHRPATLLARLFFSDCRVDPFDGHPDSLRLFFDPALRITR